MIFLLLSLLSSANAENLTADQARALTQEVNSQNIRLISDVRSSALAGKYYFTVVGACGEKELNLQRLGYSVVTVNETPRHVDFKWCRISWEKK